MTFEEKLFGKKPSLEVRHVGIEDSQIGPGTGSTEQTLEQEHSTLQLCAGFNTILERLKENPLGLQASIERLKNLPNCDGILKKFTPYFEKEHWEMIATLEAYDQATFEHSLRVASFVYDMASGGGATETYLKQRVTMEQSTLEELYTAALFHDIGKTAIPREVLHDTHSRREWAKRANEWSVANDHTQYFDAEKIEALDDVQLDAYFMQLRSIDGTDPLDIIPIREIFSPEILKELEQHAISPYDTFRKVLEYHERATGAILSLKRMFVASDIASHHHNYDGSPIHSERYPTEISAVRLGFELSLLRSMDVYDALTSGDRSYKNPFHPLVALDTLIKEAQAEFTEPVLTKYVVRDRYEKEKTKEDFSALPAESPEAKALARILAFIET